MTIITSVLILFIIWLIDNCFTIMYSKENISEICIVEYYHINKSLYFPSDFPHSQVNKGNLQIVPRNLKYTKLMGQTSENEIRNKLANIDNISEYCRIIIFIDNTIPFLDAKYTNEYIVHNSDIKNKFLLLRFNDSGNSEILTQLKAYSKILKNYINNDQTLQQAFNENATFFTILKKKQVLPKQIVILISAKNSTEEDLEMLENRKIKLTAIWNGEHPSEKYDKNVLDEIFIIYSGGKYIIGNIFNETSNYNRKYNLFSIKYIGYEQKLILKKKVFNNDKILISIENSVRFIDIVIEGRFSSVILNIPGDYRVYKVNLLDIMSVQRLSFGYTIAHEPGRWAHIRFNTTKVTMKTATRVWEINIFGLVNDLNGYNVIIYSETELIDASKLVKNAQYKNETSLKNFKISQNNFSSPDNSYVQISSSTVQGQNFLRLSYTEQNKNLQMISIETNIRSELITTSGLSPKIIFEVTNNYDYSISVPFSVHDEKGLLRDLIPKRAIIPSKGTVEIIVYTTIPSSTKLQYTNLITLTAYSEVRSQKSVIVYVNYPQYTDTTEPYLNYKYISTCTDVPNSSCQAAYWSVEITAQDSESGLLRVFSDPIGLYSPNGYVSGTKNPVTTYYSSTCCQPNAVITAIDLNNNKRYYKLNSNNILLNTTAITAIVLGILLLLIIIIIAAILITKKCKQKDSINLPRYRSQTRTTRF